MYIKEMKSHHLLVALIFLFGCGGGGGGGGSSEPAPTLSNITVTLSTSADSADINSAVTLTWSSTLASSCSASGAWSGSKATSGTESVTIEVGGSNSFVLSCSATGANSGSASASVTGLRYFDGKVFDGYIRGAEVFVDTNNNLSLDSGETSVATDNQGNFTKLLYADGTVISKGGVDLDTGADLSSLTLAHKMTGFEASKIISPITSLAAYMSQPADINAALGIDASIDVMSVDPIPNLGQSSYDYIYEKGNQLTVIAYSLQNSVNAINQTTDTSQDYFLSIAEELEKIYAATPALVDIESNTFIDAVVENITSKKVTSIDASNKTNISSAISSVVPLIQVKSLASTTTAIQNFAFRTMQSDLQSLATGEASAETVTNYTSNLITYISTDQNISSTDLEVDISALSDSASLDEDSSIEILPLTNDSYLRGQAVQLSIASSPLNGTTSLTGNVITYTPNADWNGAESFTYSIVQGSKSATGTIEVTVAPINDAPVINSASEFSVNETIQSVTTISVTDVDQDDLTYSLSGTDAELFVISSSGALSFVSSPDFENPADSDANNIYDLTVSVSDGILSDEQTITVTVVNTIEETNGPVFTSLTATPSTINVSTDSATITLTLSITDESGVNDSRPTPYIAKPGSPNYSASTPWSLVSGDSKNGTYEATITIPAGTPPGEYYIWKGYWTDINGTNTQESSAGNDHSSGYGASNGGVTISEPTLVNTAPTFISSATFSAAENQTDIGTVTATDADGDSLTFSISGSEINISSSGVLTFASAPDYETKNSYSAIVTVSDGAVAVNQDITVNVTDVGDVAATLSITTSAIKLFKFSWTDVAGATSYKILESSDGSSDFIQVGNNISAGTQSFELVVPLYKRINASYILQTCFSDDCINSNSVSISGNLVEAIGYFKASNTDTNDRFGASVSLSGDGKTLAVGAPQEDSNATGVNGDQTDNSTESVGAVYVFSLSGKTWSQQAYLKGPDSYTDVFGYSLSLSDDGNTLAVGAYGDDSDATGINNNGGGSAGNSGAAYIFSRSGVTWSQQAYIKASNSESGDHFGWSVSISADGNTLAVGAYLEDSNATGIDGDQTNNDVNNGVSSGAVYVFSRSGATWSQQAYLKASNAEANDEFGYSVSLSADGNTMAVGAPFEDSNATGIDGDQTDNSGNGNGAVYVFSRSGSTWSQQAYLKSNVTNQRDRFGWAVSMSSDGNTLGIGAWAQESNATGINGDQANNTADNSGAAYVFNRSGTTWSQHAFVKASNTDTNDYFGHSLNLSADGNTLAVGAILEDSNATGINGDQANNSAEDAGAVYIY